MKEQKIIRVELLKNMLFNLILLTLIVSTFSIFILNQFNNYLYKSVNLLKNDLIFKKRLQNGTRCDKIQKNRSKSAAGANGFPSAERRIRLFRSHCERKRRIRLSEDENRLFLNDSFFIV